MYTYFGIFFEDSAEPPYTAIFDDTVIKDGRYDSILDMYMSFIIIGIILIAGVAVYAYRRHSSLAKMNQGRHDARESRLAKISAFAKARGEVSVDDIVRLTHVEENTAYTYAEELVKRGEFRLAKMRDRVWERL